MKTGRERKRSTFGRRLPWYALPGVLLGCASPVTPPAPPAGGTALHLDYGAFASAVEPILVAHGCDAEGDCHGGGIRGGLYHSQSPESLFIHVAGLKVVCPSNPHDAKGLLLAAIRDPDPVLFFEPKRIYRAARGEVPEGDYVVPLSKAKVVREVDAANAGRAVTILAWGPPRSGRGSRYCYQSGGCQMARLP